MKFPRNAKIFRGQLDAAPFAGVFFCLLLFVLLASLTYTPGVRLQLPEASDLAGTEDPTVTVAVDSAGQFYFENQLVEATDLKSRLQVAAVKSDGSLTLLVQADKGVSCETLVSLTLIAKEAGIAEAVLATLPRTLNESSPSPPRP